ncbi:hypothetical protein AgCh_037297 [Apium graveolens]
MSRRQVNKAVQTPYDFGDAIAIYPDLLMSENKGILLKAIIAHELDPEDGKINVYMFMLNKGPVIRVLVSMLQNLPSFQKVLLLLLEKRLPRLKISHRSVSNDASKEESQVGCKRKREYNPDDMSRGALQDRQFLKKFSEMPLDKMDIEQALEQVRTLKNGLQNDFVGCQWLQQFF